MLRLGERTRVSYSLSTETRSRNTAFTASCQDQSDSGKYDSGRKSAFSTSAGKVWPPSGKRRSLASGAQSLVGLCLSSARQMLCAAENSSGLLQTARAPQAVRTRQGVARRSWFHAAVMPRKMPAAGPVHPWRCRCRRCHGRAGARRSPPPARRRRARRPRLRASGTTGTTSSASPCTSRTGGRPVIRPPGCRARSGRRRRPGWRVAAARGAGR